MSFGEESGEEQGKQNFKYNGKELDKEHSLNQYDYAARFMDPSMVRFTTVDPKTELAYSWSPYIYCFNNPIMYVDPDGKWPIIPLIIIATLLLESQPVNAPTVNTNDNSLREAWSNYNTSIATSLIPIRPGVGSAGKAGASVILQVAKEGGEKAVSKVVSNVVKEEIKDVVTSKSARREAMREVGIPTSQPLVQDKMTKSKDKVFLTRDKKHTIQDAKNDVSHKGEPHWEAGPTKKDPSASDGLNRSGSNNKPQMAKPKSKKYYNHE